jgi:hypothetical protein
MKSVKSAYKIAQIDATEHADFEKFIDSENSSTIGRILVSSRLPLTTGHRMGGNVKETTVFLLFFCCENSVKKKIG